MAAKLGVVRFLLVPSPLVGPTTWRWVADRLRTDGHDVTVVDFGDAASTGGWRACVDTAVVQALTDTGVVVGHSGAGLLLPWIAARLPSSPDRLVFVDAPVPSVDEPTPLLPPPLLDHLSTLAGADGMLPPWSEWFGPDTMAELVPDAERRAAVVADLPRLSLAYFEDVVPTPPPTPAVTYVLLSEIYRPDAEAAAARGWPVVEHPGAHLDIVTAPDPIAATLTDLAAAHP